MDKHVLLALVERWERDAIVSGTQDGSTEAEIPNAIEEGRRVCKRECADTLRTLIKMLGE